MAKSTITLVMVETSGHHTTLLLNANDPRMNTHVQAIVAHVGRRENYNVPYIVGRLMSMLNRRCGISVKREKDSLIVVDFRNGKYVEGWITEPQWGIMGFI